MATWNDPANHVWTAAEVLTAANLNSYVRTDLQFLYSAPSARVYNSGNLTISDSTLTLLTYDSERFDNDSIHSTVTNTGRLTCQTAGVYNIGINVRWSDAPADSRQLDIRLNGATVIGVVANSQAYQAVLTTYKLAAGDYVGAYVTQSSGSSKTIQAAGNYSPEFFMTWVSGG